MKYLVWLWHNTRGIRRDMAMRVVAGTVQAVLGLGVVWFSKRLIDETIRTGTTADIVRQAMLLVLLAVGGVTLRQVYVYLSNKAYIHKVGELRLRLFSGMFSRRLFDGSELHSGDVVSRLAKDIEAVSDAMATTIPQMAVMLVHAHFRQSSGMGSPVIHARCRGCRQGHGSETTSHDIGHSAG